MAVPDFSVLPNLPVQIALATTKTGCQVTSLTVWLKTVDELTDPIAFINDNNLKPEIFSKAGIGDTDYFNLLVVQNSGQEGSYWVYQVLLSHTEN